MIAIGQLKKILMAGTAFFLLFLFFQNACQAEATRQKENTAEPVVELIQNPGFENGLAGWSVEKKSDGEGTAVINTGFARSGKNFLLCEKLNGLGRLELGTGAGIPVAEGKSYRFKMFFHAAKLPPFSIRNDYRVFMELAGYDAGGKQAWSQAAGTRDYISCLSRPGEWDVRLFPFIVPKGICSVQPRLVMEGNPSTLWIDDVSLSLLDPNDLPPVPKYEAPSVKTTWAEVLATLKNRENSTAEIRKDDGVPCLFVNDRKSVPIFYKPRGKMAANYNFCKEFGEAGVNLQLVGTQAYEIWTGPGKYNFDPIDNKVKLALQGNPDAGLMLVLNVDPYPEWGNEHPDEVCLNAEGQPAIGTPPPERKRFGKPEGKNEYPCYSYYSRAVHDDMEAMLVAVLDYLKKQPYYKNIIGFNLHGGVDAQWRSYGQAQVDYSRAAVAAFRNYMRDKYKTEAAMRQTLGKNDVSFDTLTPPGYAERGAGGNFRDPARDRLLADYSRFLNEDVARTISRLARVIKQNAGKPVIVSIYYAEIIHVMSSGCNAAGIIMELRDVDIMQSVLEYSPWRGPGAPGTVASCVGSLRLHNMLFMQELDLRTWRTDYRGPSSSDLCQRYNSYIWQIERLGSAKNITEFRAISRREIGRVAAQGMGTYYYDMSGGWYHDPEMLKVISECNNVYQGLLQKENRFQPDVAVIVDEESCHWISEDHAQNAFAAANECLWPVSDALHVSGVPYDVYLLDDLIKYPEVAEHKVFMFLNAFYLTTAEREFIQRELKRGGKTLVWLWADGYLNENSKSTANIRALTGLNVTLSSNEKSALIIENTDKESGLGRGCEPILGKGAQLRFAVVEEPGLVPFGRYMDDKAVACAFRQFKGRLPVLDKFEQSLPMLDIFKGWQSVYVALPSALSPALINNIAAQAGAYVCSPPGYAVWVNDNFLCIHGTRPGPVKVNLPRHCKKVTEAFSGRVVAADTKSFEADVPVKETAWFVLE